MCFWTKIIHLRNDEKVKLLKGLEFRERLLVWRIRYRCSDEWRWCKVYCGYREWNEIIIVPPSFAKSAHVNKKALGWYKDINIHGLKLVKNGGFFITASCSFHISPEQFKEMAASAAMDAHKVLREVYWSGAGYNYPKLLASEEGDYLKLGVYQVFGK